MRPLAVALVAKRNKPLLVYALDDEGEPDAQQLTKLHFTVFAALDLVEEKLQTPPVLNYLGLLGLSGTHATYALITGATCIKVFAVFNADGEPAPKDDDVRHMLTGVHAAYVDWACNPFVKLDRRGAAVVDDPVPLLDSGPGAAVLKRRLSELMRNF